MNPLTGNYQFKEATSQAELTDIFKLRYAIYHENIMKIHCPQNERGLDFDGYDARSRHFGLYKITDTHRELIGTLRVIGSKVNPAVAPLIPFFTEGGLKPTQAFMFLDLFENAAALLQLPINAFMYEPSRFTIKKAYRSLGLAQFVIKSITTDLLLSDVKWAVITCPKWMKPVYQQGGFIEIAENEKLPYVSSLMLLSRERALKLNPDIKQRIRAYQRDGCFYHTIGRVDYAPLTLLPYVIKNKVKSLLNH
jgi:N-acyl-L-homoserine lactone synthetase